MYISIFVLFTDETLIIKDLNPNEMYIPHDYSDKHSFFQTMIILIKMIIVQSEKSDKSA